MAKFFADLWSVKVFLDDLLIFSNGTYEDHLEKVKQALARLETKNLAVNALKSYWAVKEVDYLGLDLHPKECSLKLERWKPLPEWKDLEIREN